MPHPKVWETSLIGLPEAPMYWGIERTLRVSDFAHAPTTCSDNMLRQHAPTPGRHDGRIVYHTRLPSRSAHFRQIEVYAPV